MIRATTRVVKAHRTRAATATDPAARQRAAARVSHYDAPLAQASAEIAVVNTETAKCRNFAAYKANRTRTIAALERLQIKLASIDRKIADLVTR
jgi:hypothetical protein